MDKSAIELADLMRRDRTQAVIHILEELPEHAEIPARFVLALLVDATT